LSAKASKHALIQEQVVRLGTIVNATKQSNNKNTRN